MKNAGFVFSVVSPEIEETMRRGERPQALVRRLSCEKANAVATRSGWVLAADTIVVSPTGKILGKPVSSKQAVTMLRALQGKVHHVFTGFVWLLKKEGKTIKMEASVVSTKVKMRNLKSQEILNYVKTGEPMDKAGSYAAQGQGLCLIEWVHGSFSNVVGLPMAEVIEAWKRLQ